MSELSIDEALAVFAHGYSFTRSFTYPCVGERLEAGVWVTRDAPRPKGDYRGEEYVGHGVAPAAIDAIAQAQTRGRYSIWMLLPLADLGGASETAMRADFKSLGYRLMRSEPLMVHDLQGLPDAPDSPFPVQRVTTATEAAALAQAARRRQILPEYLAMDSPPQRQYIAQDGETIVGWVASIVAGEATWCSSMYVAPAYRRRGIARSLLYRMLADDRDAGARANVLLASHVGAKLYPVVGYRQIGTLFGFMPKR